jgi:hypothetical protein
VRIARLVAAIAVATSMGAAAQSASGFAGARPAKRVSSNWAGYAVTESAGASFRSVTATWKQPKVTCGADDAGARSSVWVGLGGNSPDARGFEQIGSSSDCSATTDRPHYYVWHEVWPVPEVVVGQFEIEAGDTITATVVVNRAGTEMVFTITNRTRGLRFTMRQFVSTPDLSSAEWIVEAPGCGVGCETPRLANFGSVSFTNIAAVGNGHKGTILDRSWQATALRLRPSLHHAYSTGSTAGAAPKALAADGTSFTVAWQPHAVSGQPSLPEPAPKPVSPLIAGPRRP